jgi:hypothetical protein
MRPRLQQIINRSHKELHPSHIYAPCLPLQAIKEGRKRFIFLGQDIRLISSCGIFVTMNPGYAGRSELPDNLKVSHTSISYLHCVFITHTTTLDMGGHSQLCIHHSAFVYL